MTDAVSELTLRVAGVTLQALGVVSVTLTGPDGAPLPTWEPGAHLDLRLPSGRRRQYSLCGDPADRHSYTVAVRRMTDGHGGSAEIHDPSLIGQTLTAAPPRNHFALTAATEYLLVAGGIGITPLLPMAAELERRGVRWSAIYCGRGAETMAFRDQLTTLGGDRVCLVDTSTQPRPDIREVVAHLRPGAAVFCCGPTGLIDDVVAICDAAGVACETEHFHATTAPAINQVDTAVNLELRRSERTITVGPHSTVLQALRDAGVDTDSDCEQGYCGTCELAVLDGVPDHRDTVLSTTERAAHRTFMPCVSRARTPTLALDL